MEATNVGRTLSDFRYPAGEQRVQSDSLTQEDFLRLMVAQMSNQNPLEPQDNSEFIAQIAQFDTLTAMRSIVTAVEHLAEVNGLANAASMIGRSVVAEIPRDPDPETGFPRPPEEVLGTVELVTFEHGQTVVHVDGRPIPADRIVAVG